MTLLIIGIVIWVAVHFMKRLALAFRQSLTDRFGDGSKGIIALLLVISVVLMVIGYRSAEIIAVYDPFSWAGRLNNLLMIVAFVMFGAGSKGSWLASRMRHPMLVGFKIWAIAHLLVNGDLASIILFGSMLAWAVAQVILINRATSWAPDRSIKPGAKDAKLIFAWLVMFAIVAAIHIWLGYNPFVGDF